VYLPLASPVRPGGYELVYQPHLLAIAEVVFVDRKKGVDARREVRRLVTPPGPGQPVAWHAARPYAGTLAAGPDPDARHADVPESVDSARKVKALEKGFADFVYDTERLTLYTNRTLDLTSRPGEEMAAFRERCQRAAREQADEALAKEREKFGPRFARFGAAVPEESKAQQASGSLLDPLGWLYTLAVPPAKPTVRLTAKQQEQLRNLEEDWKQKRKDLADKWRQAGEEFAEVTVNPRRADVRVTHFGIAWAPFWRASGGERGQPVLAY
jgi:hypothetical protein